MKNSSVAWVPDHDRDGLSTSMPLHRYGVLSGRVFRYHREINDPTPHFKIVVQAKGQHWRIAINVQSRLHPSEVVYACIPDFNHPLTGKLKGYAEGFSNLKQSNLMMGERQGLDYLRENYFDLRTMRALPHHRRGPDNDIQDLLTELCEIATDPGQKAKIHVFGQPTVERDEYTGMHDVHMNQGNSPSYQHDDGVYQDGGLLVHLPKQSRTVALFLAFQSQHLNTDPETGHAVEGSETFQDVIQKKTSE